MITDTAPFHIDFVAVDDPSSVLLRQQLNVGNDFNFAGTTDIVVVYAVDNVVGGALINLTPTIVIVKRMCTSDAEHSVAIVNYLRDRFHGVEIHLNVVTTSLHLYFNLEFIRRYRSTRCSCVHNRNDSHLCWVPPQVAVEMGNTFLMLNLHFKLSPNLISFYCSRNWR